MSWFRRTLQIGDDVQCRFREPIHYWRIGKVVNIINNVYIVELKDIRDQIKQYPFKRVDLVYIKP